METFEQPKVIGYRQLSEADAAQMNEVKSIAVIVGDLVERLKASSADQRWVAIGATDLQKGFMSLVRAIAKPESF